MENFSEDYIVDGVRSGEVALPARDVPEPFVDADDIADVAVAALTDDRHIGEVYTLTGPRLLTFAEAVSEISDATGREIRYVPVSIDDFAAAAYQDLPGEFVELLTYLFGEVLDGRNAQLEDACSARSAASRATSATTRTPQPPVASGPRTPRGSLECHVRAVSFSERTARTTRPHGHQGVSNAARDVTQPDAGDVASPSQWRSAPRPAATKQPWWPCRTLSPRCCTDVAFSSSLEPECRNARRAEAAAARRRVRVVDCGSRRRCCVAPPCVTKGARRWGRVHCTAGAPRMRRPSERDLSVWQLGSGLRYHVLDACLRGGPPRGSVWPPGVLPCKGGERRD
jgi:hypothetical protein